MTSTNGTQDNALDALGLGGIVVQFPCEDCDHQLEEHAAGACSDQVSIVYRDIVAAVEPGGDDTYAMAYSRYTEKRGPDEPPLPEWEPCGCAKFTGLLENGKPRALRCRMPSNYEWSTIRLEASLPVQTGGAPDAPHKKKQLERMDWSRKLVAIAVTDIRLSSGEWQPVRIVDTRASVKGPWDLSIDHLDQGGSQIVQAVTLALVNEFNDGGPFGGKVRRFREAGAVHVPPTRASVRVPDAPRDRVQRAG